MKIKDVKASILSCPLKEPFEDATKFFAERKMVLVEIFTDEGISGIGEAISAGGPPIITKNIIEKELKEFLIGEDPLNIGKLWTKMYYGTIKHGRKGALIASMSGIDIALWDIKGKKLEQPIYKILGGNRDKIPAYASAGFYASENPLRYLLQQAEEHIQKGFKAIKIKVGKLGLKNDLLRVREIKKLVGEDVVVMVDANTGYNIYEAIKMGRLLDSLDIRWFEEPFKADDLENYCELRKKIDTPLSAGENEFTRYGHKELILRRAVDIVQPDVAWSGGISETYKIATIASIQNMFCIPHSFSTIIALVANLHLNCGIENSLYQEYDQQGDNPLRDELINEQIKIDAESYVSVPQGPGLGITINQDVFQRYLQE